MIIACIISFIIGTFVMFFIIGLSHQNYKKPHNNQWISVKDDLPRNHKELIDIDDTTKFVLVLDNGLPQVTFMYKINNCKWVWAHSYNVTHWMPIPKLDEYNIND